MRTRKLRILFICGWAAPVLLLVWIHRCAPLGPDELNVCEGVFRYQIRKLDRVTRGQISTYYLSVNGANPPDRLLSKLRNSGLAVQRASFFYSELWSQGAWHFVIRRLERINDNMFLVQGGHENDGLSASGDEYTVINREGRWVVTKVVRRWVA
jgi:hypothetical protein